jgi:hypothetical protein
MQALIDAKYPGKVVIFPNIKELPLTSVDELKSVLPQVFAQLDSKGTWTIAAERTLLDQMALEEGE